MQITHVILNFLLSTLKKEKETDEIGINIFKLNISKVLPLQQVINVYMFYIFHTQSSKSDVRILTAHLDPQLAIFQVLSSHTGLVATTSDILLPLPLSLMSVYSNKNRNFSIL